MTRQHPSPRLRTADCSHHTPNEREIDTSDDGEYHAVTRCVKCDARITIVYRPSVAIIETEGYREVASHDGTDILGDPADIEVTEP